jgi:fatty acid desaturase
MKVHKCEHRVLNSVVPLLLFVTPRLYGTWQISMTGALQHLGMANNVTDHRLNTRTLMMGPINRFLYLNIIITWSIICSR